MCRSEIHFWVISLSVNCLVAVSRVAQGDRPAQGGSLWEVEGDQQMPETWYQIKKTQTNSDTQWSDHLHSPQDDSQNLYTLAASLWPWGLWAFFSYFSLIFSYFFLLLLCFGEVCDLEHVWVGGWASFPLPSFFHLSPSPGSLSLSLDNVQSLGMGCRRWPGGEANRRHCRNRSSHATTAVQGAMFMARVEPLQLSRLKCNKLIEWY